MRKTSIGIIKKSNEEVLLSVKQKQVERLRDEIDELEEKLAFPRLQAMVGKTYVYTNGSGGDTFWPMYILVRSILGLNSIECLIFEVEPPSRLQIRFQNTTISEGFFQSCKEIPKEEYVQELIEAMAYAKLKFVDSIAIEDKIERKGIRSAKSKA